MNNTLLVLLFFVGIAIAGCEPNNLPSKALQEKKELFALNNANQRNIDDIAQHLDIKYRLVSNVPTDRCDAKITDSACFEVELTFTAKKAIQAKGWSIYFSHISPVQSPVQSSLGDEFSVTHLNGDLHQISLLENFSGFIQDIIDIPLYKVHKKNNTNL